jgi:hypothetical protein
MYDARSRHPVSAQRTHRLTDPPRRPIRGSPRENSKPDRLDADSSARHSAAAHEANALARVRRTPVAAFAIVPFAVVGVVVILYLTWWEWRWAHGFPEEASCSSGSLGR